MPAETHRQHEPVGTDAVLALIWAIVSAPEDRTEPDPHASLAALDIDDDYARFRLWDAAVEEFAERAVAEPDLEDLLSADTVGALANVIVRSLRSDHRHTGPGRIRGATDR